MAHPAGPDESESVYYYGAAHPVGPETPDEMASTTIFVLGRPHTRISSLGCLRRIFALRTLENIRDMIFF